MPLTQCKQQFASMDSNLRNSVKAMIQEHMTKYGLVLSCCGFVLGVVRLFFVPACLTHRESNCVHALPKTLTCQGFVCGLTGLLPLQGCVCVVVCFFLVVFPVLCLLLKIKGYILYIHIYVISACLYQYVYSVKLYPGNCTVMV